jgi:hypothetical protein
MSGKGVASEHVKYLQEVHDNKGEFVKKISEIDFSSAELKISEVL